MAGKKRMLCSRVKVFFENNILENTSVFSFMFRIDTYDKSDEWFEYY